MKRLLAALVCAFAMIAGSWQHAGSSELQPATLALNIFPYGIHVGFYAALERGYYEENGVDLTLTRGFGSADTVKRVGTGDVQMGFADPNSLIIGRSQGLDLKAVAIIFDKNPWVIYSRAEADVTSLTDLEGKTVGISGFGREEAVYSVASRPLGGNRDKVNWTTMDVGALVSSLLAGSVEAIVHFNSFGPQVYRGAEEQGLEIRELLLRDVGFDPYGLALMVRSDLIEKDPELVRALVDATVRGHHWALHNTEEAIDIFLTHNPASDRELTRAQWEVLVDSLTTEAARTQGIGYMTEEKWHRTVTVLGEILEVAVPTPEEVYTNHFLPTPPLLLP